MPKRALTADHNRRQGRTTNDNGNFVGAAPPVGNRGRREAECLCTPELIAHGFVDICDWLPRADSVEKVDHGLRSKTYASEIDIFSL
ncbi:hypothetical protein D3C85_660780 [compost metagenome]